MAESCDAADAHWWIKHETVIDAPFPVALYYRLDAFSPWMMVENYATWDEAIVEIDRNKRSVAEGFFR